MPHTYPDAWHNAEHDRELAWLDDWMRGRICPVTLETCPAQEPTASGVAALTTAGGP